MRVTNLSKYLATKRGIYYFTRRVPEDLRRHYKRDRIVISLRTKAQRAAEARAATMAAKLDEDWLAMRWRTSDDPFARFRMNEVASKSTPNAPLLTEAEAIYIRVKGEGRSDTFEQTAKRSIGYLLQLWGDRAY